MDIFVLLNMLSGVALFLYGMHVMGEGLKRASGGKLDSILEKLTKNKFMAVLLGFVVTAVIQSSSATTVMVVGFVNSGIMRLGQAAGVLLGANIGTTVTSWILSLTGIDGTASFLLQLCKPSSFTPILAMIGVSLLLFTKAEKKQNIGTILVGFAVLMTGMEAMSAAVKPLANVPEFTHILLMFANPVLGLLAGIVLTAIIQSSSASVGILQALSVTGAVPYSAAIPIIMGQNIGTCVTALLSSVGASKNAKRAALMHLYFKLIGVAIFMLLFYAFNAFFPMNFLSESASIVGIAVIHSAYNIAATLVLLPISNFVVRLAEMTIPNAEKEDQIEDFKLLDDLFLGTPAFAVDQCNVVAQHMAQQTKEAIYEAIDLIDGGVYTEDRAARIEALETKIDHYEDKLGTYMVKLSRARLSREDGQTVSMLLHAISDFERISDHAVNLLDSAREMHEKKMSFSAAGAAELHVFAEAVRDIVSRSFDSFGSRDTALAKTVEPLEECIDELNVAVKSRHIERLTSGQCTIEMGFVLNDISTNFERVSDHCSNIAVYLIQVPKDEYDTHEYVENIRHADHDRFDREEMAFEARYKLPETVGQKD